MNKKVEHTDRITGEITEHDPGHRRRIRDEFINDLGQEMPDPRPMSPPVGYIKQPSIFDLVRDQVARAHLLHAQDREFETFEDNDDFDIPDDPADPTSPWENDFDPPWSEVRSAIEADRAKKAADAANSIIPATPTSPPETKPTVPTTGSEPVAKQDIP